MPLHGELLHLTVFSRFLKYSRCLMVQLCSMKSQPDFSSDIDCLNHYFPSSAYDKVIFYTTMPK